MPSLMKKVGVLFDDSLHASRQGAHKWSQEEWMQPTVWARCIKVAEIALAAKQQSAIWTDTVLEGGGGGGGASFWR